MKTFYFAVADGASWPTPDGGKFGGTMRFMDEDGENRVEAFRKLYDRLAEDHSDITALIKPGQDYMLGFTAKEWDEIAGQPIRLRVSETLAGDAQIQLIQETPFI
jgi:hypothetical protein